MDRRSRIYTILLFLIPVGVLLLGLHPQCVALTFMTDPSIPPATAVVSHYSCYDLLPVGYAMYGPFLAMIATAALLLFHLLFSFRPAPIFRKARNVTAAIAAFLPLESLLWGLAQHDTPFLILISVLVCIQLFLCFTQEVTDKTA